MKPMVLILMLLSLALIAGCTTSQSCTYDECSTYLDTQPEAPSCTYCSCASGNLKSTDSDKIGSYGFIIEKPPNINFGGWDCEEAFDKDHKSRLNVDMADCYITATVFHSQGVKVNCICQYVEK